MTMVPVPPPPSPITSLTPPLLPPPSTHLPQVLFIELQVCAAVEVWVLAIQVWRHVETSNAQRDGHLGILNAMGCRQEGRRGGGGKDTRKAMAAEAAQRA